MLLAVDVGNTQTTLGLFEGERLVHMWRLSSRKSQSADELQVVIYGLFNMTNLSPDAVDGVAIATVVPASIHLWRKVSKAMFCCSALFVNVRTAGDLIDVTNYRRTDLGADRVADAVAARIIYGSPVIVVDFGTATNMEIIDREGCFVGGIIAPGIESSMNALFSHAALLPQVELVDPKAPIGRNTTKAMQVGIVYGEVERVDGLVRRVFEELGYEATVIGTGGLAATISKLSSSITAVDPDLTLQGIRLIFENQSK